MSSCPPPVFLGLRWQWLSCCKLYILVLPLSISLCPDPCPYVAHFLGSDWYWTLGQSLHMTGSWGQNLLPAVGVEMAGSLRWRWRHWSFPVTWWIPAECGGTTPSLLLSSSFLSIVHQLFAARVKQMLRLIPSSIWCSVDCLNSQDSLGNHCKCSEGLLL